MAGAVPVFLTACGLWACGGGSADGDGAPDTTHGPGHAAAQSVGFDRVEPPAGAGARTPGTYVFRDAATWGALPSVDFSWHMVVGVADWAPDGCSALHIDRVTLDGAQIKVHYAMVGGPPGVMCNQAVALTTDFARIPRMPGTVVFHDHTGIAAGAN